MRILVFTSHYAPLIGGAELATQYVIERLPGHSFDILTSRYIRTLPTFEERGRVRIYRVGFGRPFDRHLFPLLALFKAWRLGIRNYALGWAIMANQAGVAALLVRRLLGLPYVLTLQEDVTDPRVRSRAALLGPLYSAIYRGARRIHAISTFLAHKAREQGTQAPITVVSNGIDTAVFKSVSQQDKPALRKTLGLPEDVPIVITASRLSHTTAVDDFLRAVSEMPEVHAVVAGDGELRDEIHALAQSLGITDRVRFLGSVSHDVLAHYLAASDIFVRASRAEGLGTAFLEAMACGLPVVATRMGGIPDIVYEGENGACVPVNDPHAVAQAVTRLLGDRVLYEKLRSGAIEFARDFDWQPIAIRMETVFTTAALPAVLVATGIYPPDIGGPATYTKLLEAVLPAQGIDVRVVPFTAFRRLAHGVRHLAYFRSVFREAREAQMIFAQDPVSVGLPALLAARLRGKPFVVKIVGDYAWEQAVARFGVGDLLDDFVRRRYGFRVQALKYLEAFVAMRADRIIVPSDYLKWIVTAWGVPAEKITRVYNAFPDAALLAAKQKHTGYTVVSVGRLVPWKGFPAVIEAVHVLRAEIPDVHLHIIGEGPDRPRLEVTVHKLGLRSSVTLHGALSHAETLSRMRAADVFVLNTAYEGFSHQLLEAFSVGTPVITTLAGGNAEIVRDRENALGVPYNDVAALADALRQLRRDPALCTTLVERAAQDVSAFTRARMLQETTAILKSLLPRP